MLARDVMSKDVISVHPADKVEHVAKIMLDNKISGVPVVDENMHVVGMLSENDLMVKAHELKVPFYVTLFDSMIFLENPLHFQTDLKKYTAVKVRDIMTEKVITVDEDMEVSDVVDLMMRKKINRVPVLRHQKLVGIITRNDILKSLVK